MLNYFFLGAVALLVLVHEVRLRRLESAGSCEPDSKRGGIEFYVYINGQKTKVVQVFLKNSQKLPMSIAIKDAKGNAAKVDGAPQWALTDAAMGALAVAEDGMSAVFTPSGVMGVLKVQVSADADLGEGVKSILGELEIEVLAGEAVSVEIAAGEPSDI